MKYFINAQIIDPILGTVKQKFDYDVNVETNITLEAAKAELLQWVVIPRDYQLTKEVIEVKGKKRDLTFPVENLMTIHFTANLEELPKAAKK